MASVKKFTEKAISNQLRHIERTIENPANQDIDSQKTPLNYSLSPVREISSYDYYLHRKSQLYCFKRADVKTMAGWIVTAPRDLLVDKQVDFFKAVYEFLVQKYGEENCIQAYVHNDESGQPHLHYCFIPVVPDKKHGGEKICANDLLTQNELRNFHPCLQKFLNEHGFNIKIATGITKAQGGNRKVKELKADREQRREYESGYQLGRGRW